MPPSRRPILIMAGACLTATACARQAAGTTAVSPPAAESATVLKAGAGCHPGDPLAGVYRPQRPRVVQACATVRGTVDCIRAEPDGDLHIRLRVDEADRQVLTSSNDLQRCPGQPGPHLVVEVIPQHCGGVPQHDAEDNCADAGAFTTPAPPSVGEHVVVTGPEVIDEAPAHGQAGSGWAEIHPADQIVAGP
jgi:hypothetical protein